MGDVDLSDPIGFSLSGDNAHALDEWISVENVETGMRAIAALSVKLGNSAGTDIPMAVSDRARPESSLTRRCS